MDQQQVFDAEVERLIGFMSVLDPSEDDYKKSAESLRILCEARSKKRGFIIEPETIFVEACKLLAIWTMLNHERLNVITTKAIGFVRK